MQSDHEDLREIEVQSDHEGQLDLREIRETQVKQDLRGILDPRGIREMLEPRLTWIILRIGSPQM